MAAHNPCTCRGTRKERMKKWFVAVRHGNHSYFQRPKGEFHYSDYSLVCCRGCNMFVRTKAKFVETLPDGKL
jgi:hypothetical protein